MVVEEVRGFMEDDVDEEEEEVADEVVVVPGVGILEENPRIGIRDE